MTLHAVCFCIRIAPLSARPETRVVALPTECFDEIDDAWRFAEDALAEFLPRGAEPEEKFVMLDDDNEEQGYFFSCSDPDYDDHYHIVLKYSIF